jgi:hypothetical protein
VKGCQKTRSTSDRIAAQLMTWPGLEAGRPSCGTGHGFSVHGNQILHLHTGDEADLRLTHVFARRLDTVLTDSRDVMVRPGDDWVTVRLSSDTAGSLLISLTSVAIRAHEEPRKAQPCTWERARPRGRLRSLWS